MKLWFCSKSLNYQEVERLGVPGWVDGAKPGVPDLLVGRHRDSDGVENNDVDVARVSPRRASKSVLRLPLLRQLDDGRRRSRRQIELVAEGRNHFEFFAWSDTVTKKANKLYVGKCLSIFRIQADNSWNSKYLSLSIACKLKCFKELSYTHTFK